MSCKTDLSAIEDLEIYDCPLCGSKEIIVLYTCPLLYHCEACGRYFNDSNDPGIPVMTLDVARRKRPIFYGEPVCPNCDHAPHAGACEFCNEKPKPVKLVLDKSRSTFLNSDWI